jgi:A/G-specific adenine glycosylase
MLQQTRVETVIDYFYRFMEWFPTIEDLANAAEDKLLKSWEGLGYYSRVRNIQAAAKQIIEEHDGKMPDTIEEISKLKGIGPYTAGAIGSIAFGLPEPAIDGNVMRVVSRLFCIEEDIAKTSSRKIFDEAMRAIIDEQHPGEFNQALMDLGSRICNLPPQSVKNVRFKRIVALFQRAYRLTFL